MEGKDRLNGVMCEYLLKIRINWRKKKTILHTCNVGLQEEPHGSEALNPTEISKSVRDART